MRRLGLNLVAVFLVLVVLLSSITINAAQTEGEWKVIGGENYFISKSGDRITGWLDYYGYRYWLDPGTGHTVKGFQVVNGELYYFYNTGHVSISTGFQIINAN